MSAPGALCGFTDKRLHALCGAAVKAGRGEAGETWGWSLRGGAEVLRVGSDLYAVAVPNEGDIIELPGVADAITVSSLQRLIRAAKTEMEAA